MASSAAVSRQLRPAARSLTTCARSNTTTGRPNAEGQEQSRHKSKTWSRANFTKAEAQAAVDALLRQEQQGAPRRDGSMTLAAFWEQVYLPIHAGRWAFNSKRHVLYIWRRYIEPALGSKRLADIVKADVDLSLLKLAAKHGTNTVASARMWLRSILEEAAENEFISRNPARKVAMPTCRPAGVVRSLTEPEVKALWDGTAGWEYLIWRLLIMTGARIGEILALTRGDLLPNGLLIDESVVNRKPAATKNKKSRLVPLPASLRAELNAWLAGHDNALMFPSPRDGGMAERGDQHMRDMLKHAHAIVRGLQFRQCRTTFSTLFEGDIKDAQAILGHHSAAFTLQVYKKPIGERQQTAVEDLDRRLKVVPIKKGVA